MTVQAVLQIIGLIGYAGVVGLAILWMFIGLAYLKAGRPSLTWWLFVASMGSFAVIFFLLALNVTALPWVNLDMLYTILRPTAFVVAVSGWTYSMMALHDEWKSTE